MHKVKCSRFNCGLMATVDTDGHGQIIERCGGCALNARGLCRDCRGPLGYAKRAGNALRCRPCAKVARLKLDRVRDRQRYSESRPAILKRCARYRARPDVREYRRQWAEDYRARNPWDDLDRAARLAKQAKQLQVEA